MLRGKSLGTRLYAGFGAVILIAMALGAFAFTRLVAIREEAHQITADCLPGIFLAEEIQKKVQENVLLVSGFLDAADKGERAALEADMSRLKGEMDGLMGKYEATLFSEEDGALFRKIPPARERFLSIRDRDVLDAIRESKAAEAREAYKSRLLPAYRDYLAACQALVEYNKEIGDRDGEAIMGAVTSAESGILLGLGVAALAGAAIGFLLSRSITSALNGVIGALSSGSEQVASASGQVSQSSQQMAQSASEQASALEETSASLEEMSSMTQRNSENSREANAMAEATQGAVERSREAMGRMGRAIARIKGSSDQTANIIRTIDEIAFQTNLLALNAAVEAARAGDAGKDFAVVAEEVRNLAQRSAEAAKSTASLIEESQRNANHGVEVSDEVGNILSQIVASVGKLAHLIAEVSAASEEQGKGIRQIGIAVTEMDKLTQSNAASAEESASASEQLAAQAKELGEMVRVLVGIVKGSAEPLARTDRALRTPPPRRGPAAGTGAGPQGRGAAGAVQRAHSGEMAIAALS